MVGDGGMIRSAPFSLGVDMFEKSDGFQGLKRGLVDLISVGSVTGRQHVPWYWSYNDIVAQKSDPDYYPYSYVEDGEDPITFTDEDLLDWDWE